ncbi:MAG TPA: choice-of-anchor J domain-containing protein [Tenuifilaceae bacterium]|nr:choice-of-anchor J domain-containing protein [Tenuifilaceae bacterium]
MRKIFTLLFVSMVFTSFAQRDVVATKQFQLPDLSKSSKTYLVPGNWENATGATTYNWSDDGTNVGSIFGINSYGDLAYGQIFQIAETYEISGGIFWIGKKLGTEGEVVFTIWDYSTGSVGDVLGSKTVSFADITASESFDDAFTVTFDEPVTVEADFIMGADVSGLNAWELDAYDFANVSSKQGDGAEGALALVQDADGVWAPVFDLGLDADIAIFPVIAEEGETYNVTFNVDMTNAEGFDPATHKVFLTGTITDWAVPGTEGSIEMTQVTSKELPTTLSESFEDFADFTTDLTPWTTIQLTTGETYGSDGFDFDGEYTEFAFMAFNPAATDPAIDGDYPAQDGSKFAVAIQYSGKDDNKWLISPQMMGTSTSVLSFYAMSYTLDYGAERIKVLVSTTDNDPNSFSAISEGDYIEVPDNWTKYEFDLSDYDGQEFYFAIQYVSYDAFIFMLDNIQVTSSGGGTEEIFYTATVAVEPGEIQYKYFSDLVGTGWDGGEWVGDPDRVVTISEATTLNDVWGDKPQDVDTETLNNATSIYPNPVSDVLTVSHNSRISGIRVFDVTGRMMYNAEVSNLNTTTVDVSRFNEGVYILQVVTNEGIANKKFVVK